MRYMAEGVADTTQKTLPFAIPSYSVLSGTLTAKASGSTREIGMSGPGMGPPDYCATST